MLPSAFDHEETFSPFLRYDLFRPCLPGHCCSGQPASANRPGYPGQDGDDLSCEEFIGDSSQDCAQALRRRNRGCGNGNEAAAEYPRRQGIPKTLIALKYIDIAPGTGDPAKLGWKYSVHYTGWLHDGTKFDSSVDRGTPIDFIQGQHRVIPGWDEGFDGMKVGGKRRLFIPYQLAYGVNGRGPIPPKADLIFDIELVAQSDPNAPPPPPAPAAAPDAQPSATPPPATPPAAKPSTPQ